MMLILIIIPCLRWCNGSLDCQALERLVDAKTKAIILVNPNNPTGSYISPCGIKFFK